MNKKEPKEYSPGAGRFDRRIDKDTVGGLLGKMRAALRRRGFGSTPAPGLTFFPRFPEIDPRQIEAHRSDALVLMELSETRWGLRALGVSQGKAAVGTVVYDPKAAPVVAETTYSLMHIPTAQSGGEKKIRDVLVYGSSWGTDHDDLADYFVAKRTVDWATRWRLEWAAKRILGSSFSAPLFFDERQEVYLKAEGLISRKGLTKGEDIRAAFRITALENTLRKANETAKALAPDAVVGAVYDRHDGTAVKISSEDLEWKGASGQENALDRIYDLTTKTESDWSALFSSLQEADERKMELTAVPRVAGSRVMGFCCLDGACNCTHVFGLGPISYSEMATLALPFDPKNLTPLWKAIIAKVENGEIDAIVPMKHSGCGGMRGVLILSEYAMENGFKKGSSLKDIQKFFDGKTDEALKKELGLERAVINHLLPALPTGINALIYCDDKELTKSEDNTP
jgi:hypothetical protein